ncbi:DUF4019 domain-containing protein [Variovorax paradoxus]|nr:DUF4019 domain-containing protein [Variovorax paradoxus]
MKVLTRLLLAATLSWGAFGTAAAQDVEASDMVQGGMRAIQMIDQGRTDELWDGATAATRKHIARPDFAAKVSGSRSPLGAPLQRTWVAINRRAIADPDAETAGQYVSIEYETRFSNKPDGTLRELVSFHLDRDRIWRFSGYVLR